MHVQPATNAIAAGDSIVFLARLYDQSTPPKPLPQFNKSIQWTLWTLPGPADLIPWFLAKLFKISINGALNTFKAIDAYKTYIIKANLDTCR